MKQNHYINRVFQRLITVLAFTATLGGFVLIFFPINEKTCKWCILGIFILTNLIISIFLARPIKKLVVRVTDRFNVNIYFGDILECESNIVIPFNSDFDTKVDDSKISSKSLHGIFINKVYGSNVEKLEKKISEQLNSDTNKKNRQLLGTTIKIEEMGKCYFLLAFSNLDNNNKAHTLLNEYHEIVNKLLLEIHQNSQGSLTNLPLLGAGLSGVELSKQDLLEYLLIQIKMNKKLNFNSGLNIVLHESLKKEISLERINMIFNKL